MTVPAPGRRLSWFGLVGILLAFAFVPSVVDLVRGQSLLFEFPGQDAATSVLVGEIAGAVIALLAVTVLRWWPVVLREPLRMRPWVWVVPLTLLGLTLALTNWSQLRSAGVALAFTVLASTLLIATGEELVFRGILLTFLRVRYREWVSAVVATLVFGAFHLTGGPVYALSATVFGYLLYCIRRVSGGILLPIVVHTLWDFSVLSTYTGPKPWVERSTSLIEFLVAFVLLIVMVVAHRSAEPKPDAVPVDDVDSLR